MPKVACWSPALLNRCTALNTPQPPTMVLYVPAIRDCSRSLILQRCLNNVCSCPAGYATCDNSDRELVCGAYLADDSRFCGSCGNSCDFTQGLHCSGGACGECKDSYLSQPHCVGRTAGAILDFSPPALLVCSSIYPQLRHRCQDPNDSLVSSLAALPSPQPAQATQGGI